MGDLLDSAMQADIGAFDTDALITEAQKRGLIVHRDEPHAERQIQMDAPKRGHIKIGVASDTHFGSKNQQVTHLRDFCRQAGEFGVDLMLHGGDVVDGTHKMHRGMEYEQFLLGADAQGGYAAKNLPEVRRPRSKRPVEWKAIGGNHDGSFFKDAGANVLAQLDQRDDFTFLDAPAATFHISGVDIYLVHPDGGVPYALSYRPQKAIEEMPPDEKPHIWLAGHWHVPVHVPAYRNVESFTLPSFQSTTAYLKRKQKVSRVGGLLLDVEFSERGLENLTTHWVLYRTPIEKDWP